MNELYQLPIQLRDRLRTLLPERAFLRRDRGDALFVTNAPVFTDGQALICALSVAGFRCALRGQILAVSPGAAYLFDVEQRYSPDDFLCRSLERFRGYEPCEESLALFCAGLRLLEHDEPNDYARRVRQLAAVCLREETGGIYGCTLIDYALRLREETSI